MKFAIIENGVVVNVAASETALADNWIASEVANIGDRYKDGQFVAFDPTNDPEATTAQAATVRAERNAKLAASDWTQVADAPVDRAAWATYRQALRDISAQSGFPWDVQWPQQPE